LERLEELGRTSIRAGSFDRVSGCIDSQFG
jgi:hypothetical protein